MTTEPGEFICEDCGSHVYTFGPHDTLPVCSTCRFIRQHPEMPDKVKRVLRGEDKC